MKSIKIKSIVLVIISMIGFLWANPPESDDIQIEFRVKWDGRIIPGITYVSDLGRKTEVIQYRSGQNTSTFQPSPGTTDYQPIIIKRPRSNDVEFERWANKVWNFGSGLGSEVSLRDFRKDMIIELVNTGNGQVLMAFKVYRCWPSEYYPLTNLEKGSDEMAMEILVLQHEGWERDYEIQ